jgi:protein-L-isoaspartate(D-aspartate) O-methyltransferase
VSLAARKIRLIMALRRSGVTDTAVLAAIERIPREDFVQESFHDQAYEDKALPIGQGQTISQPQIVALMTQALEVTPRHKVLEIGTGSGYQTAILAYLTPNGKVFAIERLPDLLVEAEERFRRLGLTNIETRLGDGAAGWPEVAPFDGIIVGAAAPRIPEPLTTQLAPGGRLVIPVGDLASQELVILERGARGELLPRYAGGVRFVPLISRLAFTEEPSP